MVWRRCAHLARGKVVGVGGGGDALDFSDVKHAGGGVEDCGYAVGALVIAVGYFAGVVAF